MTREEAKNLLPIIQAFAEGKVIEIFDDETGWAVEKENPKFDLNPKFYRIKPKSNYRPFETHGECWNEMLKHQPFGWIICKTIGNYYNIEFLYSHKDNEHGVGLNLYAVFIDFETMFKGYNFADGTPFGISEE